MAISLVGSVTAENTSGTGSTLTFDISGISKQSNDLAVVLCSSDGGGDWSAESGWTDFGNQAHSSGAVDCRIYYKLISASESNPTFDYVSDSSFGILAIFRGVDTTTPIDVHAAAVAAGLDASPNPPSVTTVTDGAWVIALEGNDDNDNTNGTPYPSGYTGIQYGDAATFSGPGGGMAYLVKATAGSEDPGVFTLGATEQWIADTLALRPLGVDTEIEVSWAELEVPGTASSTFEESVALGASGGLAMARLLAMNPLASLPFSGGLSGARGLTMPVSPLLGVTTTASGSPATTFEPAAAFAVSQGAALTPELVVDSSLSISASAGVAASGGFIIEKSLSLPLDAALAGARDLVIDTLLPLDLSGGLSDAVQADFQPAVGLPATTSLAPSAQFVLEVSVSLSTQGDVSAARGVVLDQAAALGAGMSLVPARVLTLEAAFVLSGQAALSLSETLTFETALTLGASAGLTALAGLILDGAVALDSSAGLNTGRTVSIEVATPLGVQAGVQASAQLVFNAAAVFDFLANATLGETVTFEGTIVLPSGLTAPMEAVIVLATPGRFVVGDIAAAGLSLSTALATGVAVSESLPTQLAASDSGQAGLVATDASPTLLTLSEEPLHEHIRPRRQGAAQCRHHR